MLKVLHKGLEFQRYFNLFYCKVFFEISVIKKKYRNSFSCWKKLRQHDNDQEGVDSVGTCTATAERHLHHALPWSDSKKQVFYMLNCQTNRPDSVKRLKWTATFHSL